MISGLSSANIKQITHTNTHITQHNDMLCFITAGQQVMLHNHNNTVGIINPFKLISGPEQQSNNRSCFHKDFVCH